MLLLPYTFAIICIFWHSLLNCKSTFTTKLEKKKTFPPKRMQNAHAKCEPLSKPLLFCQLSNPRRPKLFGRNVFFSSFVVNVDLQFNSQSQKVSWMYCIFLKIAFFQAWFFRLLESHVKLQRSVKGLFLEIIHWNFPWPEVSNLWIFDLRSLVSYYDLFLVVTLVLLEIREDGIFRMTRAWDKEKIGVPNKNRTHDLPYTIIP